MNHLVSNWETKALGDVCNLVGGGTPSKKNEAYYEGHIPWATVRDMKHDVITQTQFKITEDAVKNSSTNIVKSDNVVIATRVGLGKVCLIKQDTAINQDLRGVVPTKPDELTVMYLFWWLKSISHLIEKEGTGATVQGVKLPFVQSLQIPLPPLLEQKRIVTILDEAFAGISQVVANAEKNLTNARELFESYLNNVFTQKGDGWVEKPFGDICGFVRGPFGGSLKKSCFVDDGFAVYEQQHAINDQFDHIRYYVDENKFNEMERFELFSEDLIMSCSGTMGRVAIVPEGIERGIINQALLKLSPNKDVRPEFLKYWMESLSFQEQIALHSKGAAIKNVASVKVLKTIDVPIPELSIQNSIVSGLDGFLHESKRLETIYQQKLSALSELKQSILQKAFTGELTAGAVLKQVKG